MPRKNVLFNERGFRDLAKRYAQLATEIEAVADKMRSHKMSHHISMAHTAAISDGITSTKKFIRQAHAKLDAWLDEQNQLI